jgi:hypothetical protein
MIPSANELAEYTKHLNVRLDSSLQPQPAQVDAAAAAVPLILREIPERDPYLPYGNPNPEGIIVSAPSLIAKLAMRGHDASVASWAIYRLIERGFLGAETATIHVPKTRVVLTPNEKRRTTRKQGKAHSVRGGLIAPSERVLEALTACQIPTSTKPGPVYATRKMSPGQRVVPEPGESYASHSYLVVWPTKELWDWWKFSSDAALSVTDDRPPRTRLRDVPLPDTPGFREFHNKLVSASKEGKEVAQIQIAREIAPKHGINPGTLTRAFRRYQRALRDHGQ